MSLTHNFLSCFQRAYKALLPVTILAIFQFSAIAAPPEEVRATPLLAAAFAGEIPAMKALIDSGENVNEADVLGNTPLHYTLRRTSMERRQGRVAVVAYLVNHGAYVNSKTKTGRTPLMDAANIGDTEALKFLVANGAQIDLSENSGMTAIGFAAIHLYEDIVDYLSSHKSNIEPRDDQGRTPLMQAIAAGSMPSPIKERDNKVEETSRLAIVNTLIKYHADVNTTDLAGWTPIALAAENNYYEIVRILIENGANQDIQVKSYGGDTPLMIAIRKNNSQIFKALMSAKPNLSLVNSQGRTALSFARGYQDGEMIEALKKAGAVR